MFFYGECPEQAHKQLKTKNSKLKTIGACRGQELFWCVAKT
jgi:hypothetical protein